MQLEHIDTVLRLRTPWEAIDLGFALARRWWLALYAAWFAVLLPLALLLHLLCYEQLWLAALLLWWLKPLLDRVPLYVLAQALFGTPPPLRQTLKALPGLCWRQALPALTWRRFSTARSFYLPVDVLEKLRGRERRARIKTLARRSGGAGSWLTFTCLHLEIAVNFAVFGLVWLLFPDFVQLQFAAWLEASPDTQQLLLNLVSLLGLSLIEPFYVAAGFALYLNRRTWLEAWDLELGFRQLAARLPATRLLLPLLLVLGLSSAPPPVSAAALAKTPTCARQDEQRQQLAEAASPVKQALAETLGEEAFRRCEQRDIWRWHSDKPDSDSAAEPPPVDLRAFAQLLELLLWLVVAAAALLALRYLRQRLAQLPAHRPPAVAAVAAPALYRTTPLAPPPADSGAVAWQLWQQGATRAALALLYRASIAGLCTRHALELPDYATEADCLAHAQQAALPAPLLAFFIALTRAWQTAAYAHRLPETATVQALCTAWSLHFPAEPRA